MKRALIVFILIQLTNHSCSNGQQLFNTKEASSRLNEFYSEYINGISRPVTADSLSTLRKGLWKEYLTAELEERLSDDMNTGKLDWDPFLKAQDVNSKWLETLQVKPDSEIGAFIVSYLDDYSKKWNRIHIRMILRNGEYLISDVDYFK